MDATHINNMKTHNNYPNYRFFEDGTIERFFESDCKTGRGPNMRSWKAGWQKPLLFTNGKQAYLKLNINGKMRYVHQLICEVFNGERLEGMKDCMHLDQNPQNNAASNLKWGSKYENMVDYHRSLSTEAKIARTLKGFETRKINKI